MDEFSEDFDGPELPNAVEQYLAEQRTWHRLLRGTDLVSREESAAGPARWVDG